MRRIFHLLIIVTLASGCGKDENSITVSGAFALYPLAVKWRNEYKKVHPEIRIDVVAGGAGKGMADALSGNADLGMVSRDINPMEKELGAFEIAVTRDAVVPTFNSNNPYKNIILKRGLTKAEFEAIFIKGTIKTWGELIGNGSNQAIQVFTRSDAAGAPESWAKYLGKKQEDLLGTGIFGDPGIADVIKKDLYSMGYNNLTFVFNLKDRKPYEAINVVPIDINENGKLDPEEDFYQNLDSLTSAIARGVYPSPPARPLYFVSDQEVKRPEVREFLNWVLTEGQKYVDEAGFVKLTNEQITKQIEKIH